MLTSERHQTVRVANGRLLLIETSDKSSFERTRQFYRKHNYAEVALIPDYFTDGDGKASFVKRMYRGITCLSVPKLLLSLLLTLTACSPQQRSPNVNEMPLRQTDPLAYAVLSEPPDAILDEWSKKFSSNNKLWRQEWTNDASTLPIDGQRTIRLLEIACYADLVCHQVENPLRVATLEYVRANLDSPDVLNALNWIRTSYSSGLPVDAPGDEAGDFSGLLVQSMKSRLTDYSNLLLASVDAVPLVK